MKRAIAAIFILLAVFFCSRDIILFFASIDESACYLMDVSEEESSEQNNSKDTDEKDDIDEWLESNADDVGCPHRFNGGDLLVKQDHHRFLPFFEIPSPPPERI